MEIEFAFTTDLHPQGRILFLDDRLASFEQEPAQPPSPARLVYAATHVVMLDSYRRVEHSVDQPGAPEEIVEHIDWVSTLALRRDLAACGFAIAESMDTAQRFSLGWVGAERLIRECGELNLPHGFVAGAGTDHLADVPDKTALIDGVAFQAGVIRAAGGEVILLPMPQLTRWGSGPADYVDVYRSVIEQVEGPVYIHWLGEMFLPELAGYFPGDSFTAVMDLDPDKVRGAKLSLLDADLEVSLRRRLASNDQILLTGDDFHFASLIAGGDESIRAPTGSTRIGDRTVPTGDFSHALLGIFDAIARPASVALQCLARDQVEPYAQIMAACEMLSRAVFAEPTRFYKSGLAFLAWLNGLQDNYMLINHEECVRDPQYYAQITELASQACVLRDASLAAERFEEFVDLQAST